VLLLFIDITRICDSIVVMASHPEQLKSQIESAIESGLANSICNYPHADEFDIELTELLPGKGSSHYIAIFSFSGEAEFTTHEQYQILNEFRPEIMDEIAASISRRRIPNITFKVSKYNEIT